MKVPQSPTDGAQRRDYVLAQLQYFGVEVIDREDGSYELVDQEGDSEVLYLDDPVLSRMIVHLWRRFGQLHGMLPTDLVEPKKVH